MRDTADVILLCFAVYATLGFIACCWRLCELVVHAARVRQRIRDARRAE